MIDRSYNAIPSKRNGRTDDIAAMVSHNLAMYRLRRRRQRRQRVALAVGLAFVVAIAVLAALLCGAAS